MARVTRVSLTLPRELLGELDRLLELERYASRSEAVRDALRDFLAEHRWRRDLKGKQLGVVVMIYDHGVRGILERLASIQHRAKGVVGPAQHWHLDERDCLETLMVRGRGEEIRELVDKLESARGVKQVKLIVVKK
jgi:CopG family nickel-responsive transcriptional regulator